MADIQDVIRRLIIQAETHGFDRAASEMRSMVGASKEIVRAEGELATATTETEKKLGNLGRQFDAAANRADPLRREMKLLQSDLVAFSRMETFKNVLKVDQSEIDRLRQMRIESTSMGREQAANAARVDAVTKSLRDQQMQLSLTAGELQKYTSLQKAGIDPEVSHGRVTAPSSGKGAEILALVEANQRLAAQEAAASAAHKEFMDRVKAGTAEMAAADARVDAVTKSLNDQHMQLRLTSEEYQKYAALQRAGLPANISSSGSVTSGGAAGQDILRQVESVQRLTAERAEAAAEERNNAAAMKEAAAAADREQAAIDSVTNSLETQNIQLRLSVAEFEKYAALQRAGQKARISPEGAVSATSPVGRGILASVEENQRLLASQREQANALRAQATEYERLKRSAAELRQQVDPVGSAQERAKANVAEYSKMLRAGMITQDHFNAAIKRSEQALAGQSKGIGLSASAMQNLGFQMNDVISGIAMGQGGFTILAQQGGQFYQILAQQGQGGLIGGVRALGGYLGSLLTVGRVAFGGVVGGAVLAATAVSRYADSQNELRLALGGVGRETNTTVKQLGTIAEASARAGGVSVATAKEMAAAFAATGRIGTENIGEAIKFVRDYATTTGQEIPEAAKEMASGLAGGVQGFDALNEKLGFGDAKLREYVRSLNLAGKESEAQRATLDAMRGGLVKTDEATGLFARGWHNLKTAVSDADESLGKFLRTISDPLPLDKRLKEIEDFRKKSAEDQARRTYGPAIAPRDTTQRMPMGLSDAGLGGRMEINLDQFSTGLKSNLKTIEETNQALDKQRQKEIELADAIRKRGEREEEANLQAGIARRSIAAEKATKAVFSEIEAYQQLEKQISDITKALDDKNRMAGEGMTPLQERQAGQARESAQIRSRAMMAGAPEGDFPQARMNRAAEDFSAQTQSAMAFTQAEKELAAARIARTAAQREGLLAAAQDQAANIASQQVALQTAAALNQQIQQNSIQLSMGPQLLAAARMQGMEGIRMNAMLQEQIRLQQQGIDVSSGAAQSAIKQAGAMAELATKIKDVAQATEIRSSGRDQVEMIQLETSLIGANSIERERRMAIMQGEIQARALERQGMMESAAATREMTSAIANANARQQQQVSAVESVKRAWEEYNRVIEQNIRILESQGRSTSMPSMPLHQTGGTTRASDWPQAGANGAPMTFGVNPSSGDVAGANAQYGQGNYNWTLMGGGSVFGQKRYWTAATPDLEKVRAAQQTGLSQIEGIGTQALQRTISLAMDRLGKQISKLEESASEAAEVTQDASSRRQELESKIQQNEQRRQAEMQAYLAAGPSPTEQNADLFYDPKKRLLFAEKIAGNTSDALKIQLAQLQAEEAAAKAQEKAINQQAEDAKAQIQKLEDQRTQLEEAAELLSHGVELSQSEVDHLVELIKVVRNELPASMAEQFNRILQGSIASDLKQASIALGELPQDRLRTMAAPVIAPLASLATAVGTISSPSSFDPLNRGYYGVNPWDPKRFSGVLGGITTPKFQHGGEFTVPGSYSAGDKPFVLGLAGQERVTIETPDQQRTATATPSPTAPRAGTVIENLIVRLPATVDPITYMNKKSRPSLSRAVRGLARSM
jgi:hypothetical protein